MRNPNEPLAGTSAALILRCWGPIALQDLCDCLLNETCGSLTIRAQLGDGHLRLSVIDAGAGPPMERRDLFCDAFFATKPKSMGWQLAAPSSRRMAGNCAQARTRSGERRFI